ncbi:LAFA_0D05512g1_1 [Lachancea sp. 'fantastica']|nr:LAFA_0D05512g1_1 [Lachancea sp. 'fantastica']
MGDDAPIRLPSSPVAPETSPPLRLDEPRCFSSPFLEKDVSVVDKLQQERQRQHGRFKQPFSSPLRGDQLNLNTRWLNPRDRRRSWQAHRQHQIRETRSLQARGGAARMEHDVMTLERNAEQLQLATQAQWYQMDPDEIEDYDTSESDDDELVAILQEREDYETQLRLEEELLEYAMGQFNLNDNDDDDNDDGNGGNGG